MMSLGRIDRRDASRTLVWCVATACTAACGIDEAAAQRARIPTRASLGGIGLERMFLARAPIDSGRDSTRLISGDEEVVFLVSKSGVVSAFDSESGRLIWTQLAGGQAENVTAVVTDIDAAYVVIGERLYAFDKLTGGSLWNLRIPFVPVSAPVFDEERMYLGTLDGSVYAFELAKIRGYAKLGQRVLQQYIQDTVKWRHRVGGTITSAPVLSAETVCFTSDNGSLFGIKAESHQEVFQYETDRSVSAPLVADEGVLYMAGLDATLYAIDMAKGVTLWEFVASRRMVRSPLLIGPSIYISPIREGVFRLTRDGQKVWQAPDVTGLWGASDTRIYAYDEFGRLRVLDIETGRDVAALSLRDFPIGLKNEKTDRIYLATTDGVLMALREIGAEFPIFHARPKLQPILPAFGDDDAG